MKTQSTFDIQELLTFLTNLQQQLPADSAIANQLQAQTQQWLSTVMAALACLDETRESSRH
jgi:hypothetical protein